MEIPKDMQKRIVEVLQEDNTIVFVMSNKGEYLSLLGGTNKALYSDGSILIGKNYHDVFKKEKVDLFQSMLDEVSTTKAPLEKEYSLGTDDFLVKMTDGPDAIQSFRGNIYPLEADQDDHVTKVVWVVHNITTRKK